MLDKDRWAVGVYLYVALRFHGIAIIGRLSARKYYARPKGKIR